MVAASYLNTNEDVSNLAQDLAFALEDGELDMFCKQLTSGNCLIPADEGVDDVFQGFGSVWGDENSCKHPFY